MHPIVVGVDFSNSSVHAIEYAIPLANKIGSDIVLVWVDKFLTNESIYPDTSKDTRNEAKKRFTELIAQYKKDLAGGIKMEYKLRKGKIYHELEILAKSVNAMMIIAGSHGLSGYEEYWIGSNAYKIVTYASCPVITVKFDFPIGPAIERILVPISSNPETLHKVPFVAKLAEIFNSELHVVVTHYSSLKSIQKIAEKYGNQAAQFFKDHKVRTIYDTLVSEDITKAVITYSAAISADLIGIMTDQETPATILLGPHSQRLINQSPQPVLSMHPQENFFL
jgi:nucleotide-binding universal stress UspA family protein